MPMQAVLLIGPQQLDPMGPSVPKALVQPFPLAVAGVIVPGMGAHSIAQVGPQV